MSDNPEKSFSICQVFNNISGLKYCEVTEEGKSVECFGVFWKIRLYKFSDGAINPWLCCESSKANNWSIKTVFDMNVGGISYLTGQKMEFKHNCGLFRSLSIPPKKYINKYGIYDSVTIEFRVRITEMTGIEEKQKSMNFDDDVAKASSDVVLVIGDQKFYICKMYLSFHSTYFKSLFSGNFQESGKSEIELKDIDPDVFQYFLELIYGISSVDDTMIMEILKLADFFDAQIVMKRCEEFFLNGSEKPLKVKFQAALKFRMEKLKVKCYSEMKEGTDFREFLPQNAHDYSQEDYLELLEKVVSFR
ncbi:unnamed protein product [Caenorhabditis nigoni]